MVVNFEAGEDKFTSIRQRVHVYFECPLHFTHYEGIKSIVQGTVHF